MNHAHDTLRESLLARKQAVVREHIYGIAINLFYESGFDEVTVEEIALLAGVSRRTFFRYFSSKEDVLASAFRAYATALTDAIMADQSGASAITVVRGAIVNVLRPFLASAEKTMCIAKRSVSVRTTYVHQGPVIHEKLATAFATRAGRTAAILEDHALAILTLLGTNLCTEVWISQRERPLPTIVEEVFCAFATVTQGQ